MARQRYRVLERIDAGGMAEVFRAEATSLEGFSKVVAIKRVLPSLSKKRKFIRMFLDEAKLSLGLTHGNIVQVFDLGRVDETYFIVMEFVAGTTVRAVLRQCLRTAETVPVPEAVYIIAEVCKGLSYAHGLEDAQGRSLDVVHRDISPPNILLSRQGEVKITDFGLAKARSQLERTDPGFVKGKFSYLSPEAAYGEPIDHRTDIFAAGIVLWELLAGRRLFNAETENKTLGLVRKAKIPDLTAINPEVSSELDAIVRKALARDRNGRFRTAAELGNALMSYLFDHNLKVAAQDISRLVAAVLEDGSPRAGGTVADHVVEEMIQEEIERFVSLEGADDDEDAPTTFEDPSTWFDGDDGDGDDRSVELQALRIGPQVTDVSTAFPVAKMQEAVARGEAGWELREGGAPAVRESALDPEIEAAGMANDSLAIPIEIVDDLIAETKAKRARDRAGAADAPIALDPSQGPGVDGLEVEFDDAATPSLEDAWLDGDLDDVFEDIADADEALESEPAATARADAPRGGPVDLDDLDLEDEDEEDDEYDFVDVAAEAAAHLSAARDSEPSEEDDDHFAEMPAPITAVVDVEGADTREELEARLDRSLPDARPVRDVVPKELRRPSDALLLPVQKHSHVLQKQILFEVEDEAPERPAQSNALVWFLILVLVGLSAAIWYVGFR